MDCAASLKNWWRIFKVRMMADKFDIKTIKSASGKLSVLERMPFEVKRVYYLHGIDVSAMRGGHAHKKTDRIMIAVNGSFKVSIRYNTWKTHLLDNPTVGLRILPKEWVEVTEFSEGAICLVLASTEHDESDCVRDFSDFRKLSKSQAFCDCRQGRDPCDCERSVL